MYVQEETLPFKVNDVEPKFNTELLKHYTGELTGFIQVGPKKYFFPKHYENDAADIYNMVVRPDDLFVVTFPRSGTTWTQELVWMIANDLDYAKSAKIPLTERYIFIELSMMFHPQMIERFKEENKYNEERLKVFEMFGKLRPKTQILIPSPRYIKSHLPLSLLPPNMLETAKAVYVARDPRDVMVSYYFLKSSARTLGFVDNFKTFWHLFINDAVYSAPYFEHLKEAWNKRNHPNMLFLFYEELSKDLPSVIRRVAKFLNKQYSEDQIRKLCEHLSIENFKKNKSLNMDGLEDLGMLMPNPNVQPFIRKGKVGGWRDYFDEEMIQQTDRWMAENLKDTDFRFPHLDNSQDIENSEKY